MLDEQTTTLLHNLNEAHNALNATVNKHIEFTSALSNSVRSIDEYNDSSHQIMYSNIRENANNIIKGKVVLKHIVILYICVLITMITVGWKLI